MCLAMVLFTVRTRRLVEGAGKYAGKRLLRVKPIAQADIVHASVGFTQVARRQQQLAFTIYSGVLEYVDAVSEQPESAWTDEEAAVISEYNNITAE